MSLPASREERYSSTGLSPETTITIPKDAKVFPFPFN